MDALIAGMVERVDGLRERKKQATRVALAAAAVRLCLRDGVERVTVDDIAADADVSPRTFFNYFACKEEAIVDESRMRGQRLIKQLGSRPHDEAIADSLRSVMLLLVHDATPETKRWIAEIRMLHQTPSLLPYQLGSYVAMERSLAEVIADRTGTDAERDMYPRLVAGLTIAATRVALSRWLDCEDERPLRDFVGEALDQVAPAFALPADRPAPVLAGTD
ncbi:TetR family transcriptional regulator [Fodinicola feengrottensis]|uniref:TetR family transcriptional regulator n=2 Tax=Fodinicola feengrottensis TaxID=435914 RepID=A0ABN2HW69_9ACTN